MTTIRKIYRERVEEVVEAPGDDHVVVTPDDASHDRRPESDSSEARMNRLPDSERSLPKLLTDPEFQKEERHSLEDHHDQKGNDERALEISITKCLHFCFQIRARHFEDFWL